MFFLGTKYSQPMKAQLPGRRRQGEADDDGLLRHRRHPHRRRRHRAEPRQGRHHLAGAASRPTRSTCCRCRPSDAAGGRGCATRSTSELEAAGIEVLYDDRDERPGVKFKDADLVGHPLPDRRGQEGAGRGGGRGQGAPRARGGEGEDRRGGGLRARAGRARARWTASAAEASAPRQHRPRASASSSRWTCPICRALDELLDRLEGQPAFYKVGLELFVAEGERADRAGARRAAGGVFLDLKLHDIPETVARAVRSAARIEASSC